MATLKDVSESIKKLNADAEEDTGRVVSAVEESGQRVEEALTTNASKDLENKREAERKQDALLSAIENIKPSVIIDGEEEGDTLNLLEKVGIGAALTGALAGTVAGLVTGFVDFYKKIFKLAFPNLTKRLKDIFGKGGSFSKFITSIREFFTKNKAFTRISKIFSDLKKTVTGFGKSITKFLKPVKTAFQSILKIFKGAQAVGNVTGFLKTFKKFFNIFKNFFTKLFFPLQVLIGIFSAGFEAKDAIEKSEGFFAKLLNGIVGAVGGLIDGIFLSTADFIKDGLAMIAGFLGFENIEKFLNSFSLSDIFNKGLDGIYAFVNEIFAFEDTSLKGIFKSLIDLVTAPLGIAINFIKGIFEFGDPEKPFKISEFILGVFDDVKKFFTDIFSWTMQMGTDESGEFSIPTLISEIFGKVKKFFTDIFSWTTQMGTDESGDFSIPTLISTIFGKVKTFFTDLFTFSKPDESGDFSIPTLISTIFGKVKTFFTDLFTFSEPKAGKEFSFGDLVMSAITKIKEFFGKLLDIDVIGLAKKIPGVGKLLGFLGIGDEKPVEKTTPEIKKLEETTDAEESSVFPSLDLGTLLKPIREKIGSILNPDEAPFGLGKVVGFFREKLLNIFPKVEGAKQGTLVGIGQPEIGSPITSIKEIASITGLQRGGLVGSPTTGSITPLESGGLFTLSKGEFVLDNQASELFMKAAAMLAGSRDMARGENGGQPIIINNNNVDNSSRVSTRQNVSVPMAVRSTESTKMALDMAYNG